MSYFPLKISILVYLLSSLIFIPSVAATDNLPPILDYYPNCSYNVIEKFTAKIKTEQPRIEKTKLTLLNKLRNRAKLMGADAIIIIDKEVIKVMNSEKYYGMNATNIKKYTVSYRAELIKPCQAHSTNNQKLAPYDKHGNQMIKGSTTITIKTKYVFTPPKKAKLNHPIITNKELSLENGIYGVNIGESYQQVVDVFGEPSIVLSMFEGEIIVGYGRKHWLHFQNDKLVKVQSNLAIVSPMLLNMVPLRDFFYDSSWIVANKLVRTSSLTEVKSVMMTDMELNNQKELVIKGKENSLILFFSYRKDTEANEKNYYLKGFTLKSNSYKKPKYKEENQRGTQFDTLGLILSTLSQGNPINLERINSELGQPIGRITVSATSYVDIYNSNLLVEVKRSQLASIQLLEELFSIKDDLAIKTPWSLGDFVQGKNITELKKFFPVDMYEIGNAVEIDSDEFQLTLLFDDSDDSNTLYEAMLTLY